MADVGLVVVSHSRPLAEAALALAVQMAPGRENRTATAAGLDDGSLGTDATAITEAIACVDGPDGVVVLMDLGSAVLSTELALELLPDPVTRDRVMLSPGPLVEGLVVASVTAAGGADRFAVLAETRRALAGKADQLGEPSELAEDAATASAAAGPEVVARVKIGTEHGLHARPAARLVTEAATFDAQVSVRNATTNTRPVPATSLSRVAALAVLAGHELELAASGHQARQAVDALVALAKRDFGERDATAPAAEVSAPKAGRATVAADNSGKGPLPASPGVVVGPLRRLVPVKPVAELPTSTTAETTTEADRSAEGGWERLTTALAEVRRSVEGQRDRTTRAAGEDEAGIFTAHLALLADPELLDRVHTAIDAGRTTETAWAGGLAAVEKEWAELPDPYLRARAADVRAVRDQVLRALTGETATRPSGPGVLVAADLTPGEVADLDPAGTTGLVLAGGSPTAHAALVARARGIPAVVGAGGSVLELPEGTLLAVDGENGELVVDPDDAVRADFAHRAEDRAAAAERDRAEAAAPAVTSDGTIVAVQANVGLLDDVALAVQHGADGSGLVRTELLFASASQAPGVDAQEELYRRIVEEFAGRPVTVRTFDVGGDKPVPFLAPPAEANPFLGLRGLRLTLAQPDVLYDQLTALCRVARDAPLRVMVPMVSTPAELARARELLVIAAGPDGLPPGLGVGMMVEVPAAALALPRFLPDLDFVSIGTNDLVQYAMAAERGNPAVAALADPLEPGVLRLVDLVCRVCRERVPVSVCGDAAADPLAVPVLLGLGVGSLSVPARDVPQIKTRVRALHLGQCAELAAAALELDSAAAVRALVRDRAWS